MTENIKSVDRCCGLNWGDEAKGKIIAQLSKNGKYDFVWIFFESPLILLHHLVKYVLYPLF